MMVILIGFEVLGQNKKVFGVVGDSTFFHSGLTGAAEIIYNKAKGETIYDTAGATRATHTQSLTVPNDWEGDKVEVYLGMVSDDGKEVADSIYLGEVTLTPA